MKIEYFSGDQRLQAPDVLWITQPVSNDYGELTGNPGKEYVRFRRNMVPRLASRNTHIGLEMINSPFHNGPDLVKGIPFIGIPLDTGKLAEIHVFVSIGGTPLFCRAAGVLAVADIRPLYHMDLGTAPFFAVSPPFLTTVTKIFHVERGVIGTGGITVTVISDFWERTFIANIIRDEDFGEMEFIFQKAIGFDGVKGRISQEDIGRDLRMEIKVIGEDRMEAAGVSDRFVFIRRIGFLMHGKFRMSQLKRVIKKGNMPDNAKAIGKDSKFVRIAEMAIDVLLFGIGRGSGLGGHEGIGHPVGVDIGIILIVSLQPFNEGVEGFGVVFGDIKLNAGGIKGKDIRERGVNQLADGFGEIDQRVEHLLDMGFKRNLEAGKERSIGDFGKAAEVPQLLAKSKEKDEERIGWDGKDLLQDQSGEKAFQRIEAFATERTVESAIKIIRDEIGKVNGVREKLEKGRGIIPKQVLTV